MEVIDYTSKEIGIQTAYRFSNNYKYIIDFTGNTTLLYDAGIVEIDEEKSAIFLFFNLCDTWKDKDIKLYQTLESTHLGTNDPDIVTLVRLAVG